MFPNERPALCVAIHDVAPATWSDCVRLLHAIRAVADIPLTWLVVPRYHGSMLRSLACEAALERLLSQGHELVLHGYTHRDAGAPASSVWRTVVTEREGEFAALAASEARRRIELGLGWFKQRHWPVSGFVAPAWMVGRQVWPLLGEYGFAYTTTFPRFYVLRPTRSLMAPALVYAARNRLGRLVSPRLDTLAAALSGSAPLVRLALHPRDARYPALLRHAQHLVEQLLETRQPLTKAEFARRLTSTGPTLPRHPIASAQNQRNTEDSRSARLPPWH
ncbi:MAG: polysaccharide deacetylase family protein [Pseudomonadota bacterium]